MKSILDPKNLPIFIISYNRLEYLKKLVKWLENRHFENIIIIDNNSSYPPLLEYLENSPHKITKIKENLGHLALYKCGLFDEIINSQYYVLTDPDVIPLDECPDDFLDIFYEFLMRNKEYTKIGFSLKTDDLPDFYTPKTTVIKWEEQFKKKEFEFNFKNAKMHRAIIDTTFALYRPNIHCDNKKWWSAIRSDYPYQARHLAWYENSESPTEEDIFYKETAAKNVTSWTNDKDIKKRYQKGAGILKHLLKFIKDYIIFFTRKSFWKTLEFNYKKRFNKF